MTWRTLSSFLLTVALAYGGTAAVVLVGMLWIWLGS